MIDIGDSLAEGIEQRARETGFSIGLKHYIKNFGTEYLGMLHVYQFFIDETAANELLEVYSYEWN